MNKCDDCDKEYPGDPYYTFEADSCSVLHVDPVTGEEKEVPHDCTENMCPECAGPFLEPDTDGDPRRPAVDFYDERMHANLIDAENYRKHGDQIPVA